MDSVVGDEGGCDNFIIMKVKSICDKRQAMMEG